MDLLLEETATRIFVDHRHEPATLWAQLEDNGLTRLWVSEADGGFALSPLDGFGVIRLAGRYAAPVPLTETLVATWFLSEANLPTPPGRLGFMIDSQARAVAFGNTVEHIVKVRGESVTLHRGSLAKYGSGIGEDPFGDSATLAGEVIAAGDMADMGGLYFPALARAAQICGALEAVLELTVGFAEQRVQFGRSLSKFQAIQHLLSEMGGETAAAGAALDAAVATVGRGQAPDRTAIAVAKFRASLASGIVAEHAHQVHGAIGYTQEYELAHFTRRLWQWREDFGAESYWADELGRAALSNTEPLWPKLTDKPKLDKMGAGL